VAQRLSGEEFQIGFAMAGAISAGAYSAGVLDFFIQALEAWENLDNETFTGLIESHAAKRQSEEAAEGFASFLEKRPARWKLTQKPT